MLNEEKKELYWQQFKSNINDFKNKEIAEWDEWQFLGYMADKFNMPIEQENNPPSRHTQLQATRGMIKDLLGYKFYTKKYNRFYVKNEIDNIIKDVNPQLTKITSLNFLKWQVKKAAKTEIIKFKSKREMMDYLIKNDNIKLELALEKYKNTGNK